MTLKSPKSPKLKTPKNINKKNIEGNKSMDSGPISPKGSVINSKEKIKGKIEDKINDKIIEKRSNKRAIQIVKVNDEGTKFQLDEEALENVLKSVPDNMKTSIISVVGAFRTGKSFILDIFLRYLYSITKNDKNINDMNNLNWLFTGFDGEIKSNLEGNSNYSISNDKDNEKSDYCGFSWRAGRERNTTGIWIWGESFIISNNNNISTSTNEVDSKNEEKIALLLLDTQGMFDSETSQMLTASIFGFNTLLSSYLIYNIDKKIQEDNLQHLALFAEYGRMALAGGTTIEEDNVKINKIENTDSTTAKYDEKTTSIQSSLRPYIKTTINEKEVKDDLLKLNKTVTSEDIELNNKKIKSIDETVYKAPFQTLEFLVRDWQNFDEDDIEGENNDEKKILKEMDDYLNSILKIKSNTNRKDLNETREQIFSCFDSVKCFLLPHPGLEITKKNYDGDLKKLDKKFIYYLNMYMKRLFDCENIIIKSINNKVINNSNELLVYIKVFFNLFKETKIFPEAKTLLEATSEANNINNNNKSISIYKDKMNLIAGMGQNYCSPKILTENHLLAMDDAIKSFDISANMGRRSQIVEYRNLLIKNINKEYQTYQTINKERDPFKNIDIYIIPAILIVILLLFRSTQDLFCYDHIGFDIPIYDCKHVSKTLTHFYYAILTLMILMFLATGQKIIQRIKNAIKIAQELLLSSNHNHTNDLNHEKKTN